MTPSPFSSTLPAMPSGPLPSPWRVLFLSYLASLAFGFSFQAIPPLVELLVSRLGFTLGGVGLLMGLFTLPGILLALPGGVLSDRIGHGRVALGALALMTAGTLLMLVLTPLALFGGRFIAGCGAAVLVTAVPPIISRSFPGRQAGSAMAVYNTAMPVATLVSFNLFAGRARELGIPAVFAAVAALCAATFLAFLLGFQEHPEDRARRREAGARPPAAPSGLLGLGPGLWILSLAWGFNNIAVLGFLTFGGDFLHQRGYDLAAANLIDSLPMAFGLLALPAAGFLVGTPARKGWAVLAGCLLPALAILLFLADPGRAVWWAALMGVGMGVIPPAVFTAIPLLVPPGRVATGFGVLNTVFNLMVFAGVPAAGVLRDATGGYPAAFLALSAAGAAGGGFALLLARKGHLR